MRTWIRSILTAVSTKRESFRPAARYRPMLEALETRDLMSGIPVVDWNMAPIQLPGEAFKTGQTLYLSSEIDLWDAPDFQDAVSWGLRLSADSNVDASDKLIYSATDYGVTGVGNLFSNVSLPPGSDPFWSNANLEQGAKTFWVGLYVKSETTGQTEWYGTEAFDVKPGIYATFDSRTGLLKVVGTDDSEVLNLRGKVNIAVDTVNIYYIREKVSKAAVAASRVTSIEAHGGGGDDVIQIDQRLQVNTRLFGGGDNDNIRGGSGSDIIRGGSGDDKIFGRKGDDFLYGDADNDWLDAGSTQEYVNLGSGNRDWNARRWVVNGTRMDDVRQGHQGNCYFLAPLASLAMRGWNLKDRIRYVRPFYYRVQLFGPSGAKYWKDVFFDGTVETSDPGQNGGTWVAAKGEFWVLLFSRAGSGDGGSAGDALQTLTGMSSQFLSVSNYTDRAARNRLFNRIERAIKGGGFGGTSTVGQNVIADSWWDSIFWGVPTNIVTGETGHSYTVVGVVRDPKTNAPKSITLRNPWGFNPESGNAYITLQWDFFCDWFRQVWIN